MDSPADRLVAADVVRGVSRLLYRQDYIAVAEVPLGNGRRADIMGPFVNGPIISFAALVGAAVVLALNGVLILHTFGVPIPGL